MNATRSYCLAFCMAAGLAGCSLFGTNDNATLRLQFISHLEAQELPAFSMTVLDRRRTRTFDREDFTSTGGGQFDAGPFDTGTSGTLRIACSLLDTAGETLAAEEVALPLHSDWRYSVTCTAGQHNPYRACFGCVGYEARSLGAALGFAPGDSLFIVWGGTSISSPVLY